MADLNLLYKKCLTPGTDQPVSATLVASYLESPWSVWCQLFAPPEERDPLHPYQQMLFDRGQEHESVVVEKDYPAMVEVSYETEEEGFRKALEAMQQGIEALHSMPLMYRSAGMFGRFDLVIKKVGATSNFGRHYYEVVEIKLAKNLRASHIIQGAFYTKLLGLIQGYTPKQFHIINGESETLNFNYQEYEAQLDDAINEVREVLNGAVVEPCHGSGKWPWENYGNRVAIEKRDVSLIPGVGPALQTALKAAGFVTVDDVKTGSPSNLRRVKGIGAVKSEEFHLKARAIVTGEPIRIAPVSLPQKSHELFLDLEGTDPRFATDGLPVVNYLIGLVARDNRDAKYISFVADAPKDEEKMLRKFCHYVSTLDDYVIYHWHNYERVHLGKMFDYYGIASSERSVIMDHLVDLSPITTKCFAFPVYSTGLKAIAKSLGFKWRQEDVDALASVVLYQQYVDSNGKDKEALKKITAYNEDDCRATLFIKDWLVKQK